MKTPLALLALCLSLPAAAQNKAQAVPAEPTSKAVEEPPVYWHSSNSVSWWGDVVGRTSITLVDDLPRLREICMVPPAADWVTEGAKPEIEHQYLILLSRLAYSLNEARGTRINIGRIGRCGVRSFAKQAYLGEFANTWFGSNSQEIKQKTNFNGCLSDSNPAHVGGPWKYASRGKSRPSPSLMIVETVNALLRSKNPETVKTALSVAQEIAPSDKWLDTLETMVKDKSLTAEITIQPEGEGKETLTLRAYAMRALAATNPTERTAKLLALIWHDDKEDPKARAAALRAYSFAVEDAHLEKTMFPLLNPLIGLYMDENDKKEEAGAKGKLSEVGEAAECAKDGWPKEKQRFAAKGLDWDGNPMGSTPKTGAKKK